MRTPTWLLVLGAALAVSGFAPVVSSRATTNPPVARTNPVQAFEAAVARRDPQAALKALEAIPVASGSLNTLDPYAISWLDGSLADAALEARLASILDRADYRPADAMICPDDLWLKHAVAVIGTDKPAAERALLRLCSPYAVARARFDRRFFDIVAQHPAAFSLRAAVKRTIKGLGEYVERHSDLAEPQIEIAFHEAMLGRDGPALDRLNAVLADSDRYIDATAQRSSALNYRAMILGGDGRWDEALADWRAAIDDEEGEARAYHLVSYAKALIDADRAAEAWPLLEAAKPETAYFQVNADEARVCALQHLDRGDEAHRLFATIPARRQANRFAVFRALVCLGDEDALAAEAILWLEHPLWRQDMLLQLSNWKLSKSLSPGQTRRMALQRRLPGRPDVRAAITRAGRLERIDLIF
jgi:tetratricopeptide (TPR) repeat protein